MSHGFASFPTLPVSQPSAASRYSDTDDESSDDELPSLAEPFYPLLRNKSEDEESSEDEDEGEGEDEDAVIGDEPSAATSSRDTRKAKKRRRTRFSDDDEDEDEALSDASGADVGDKKKKKTKNGKKRKRSSRRKRASDEGRSKKKRSKLEKRSSSEADKIRTLERQNRQEKDRTSAALWRTDDSELWKTDTSGDPDNALFGTLFPKDVPKFKRTRRGAYLLGGRGDHLSGEIVRVLLSRSAVPISLYTDRKFRVISRYYSRKHQLLDRDRNVRRYRRKAKAAAASDSAKPPAESKKKIDRTAGLADLSARSADFDAVGGADYVLMEDNDTEDADAHAENFEEYMMRRTKEFNIATRERPNDIAKWREFADFQDEGQRQARGASIEKKISILEKALESNPDDESLLLVYLHLCSQHWDPNRVLELWSLIIDRHPESSLLWKEYIRFRQSQFPSFSVSESRTVHAQALRALCAVRDKFKRLVKRGFNAGPSSLRASVAAVEDTLLSVFFRACNFERQAGYIERAVAMFQAMIEFNCFCPTEVTKDTKFTEKLRRFELFWESDAPRIGSKVGRTWRTWLKSAEDATSGSGSTDAASSNARRSIESWLSSEYPFDTSFKIPSSYLSGASPEADLDEAMLEEVSRNLSDDAADTHSASMDNGDDGVEVDLHGVVLFDDIRDFVFEISDEGLRKELILEFLVFLGVEPSSLGGERRLSSNLLATSERSEDWELFETVGSLLEDAAADSDATSAKNTSGLLYTHGERGPAKSEDTKESESGQPVADVVPNPLNLDGSKYAEMWLNSVFGEGGAAQLSSSAPSAAAAPTATTGPVATTASSTTTAPASSSGSSNGNSDATSATSQATAPVRADDKTYSIFIRNVLEDTVGVFPTSVQLRCCLILLESKLVGIEAGRKIARALLEKDQLNLRLWNAFACAERKFGGTKEARKIYSTALSLCSKTKKPLADSALLFWAFFDLELSQLAKLPLDSDPSSAASLDALLHILCSCAEGKFTKLKSSKKKKKKKSKNPPSSSSADANAPQASPIRVVKCRKLFREQLDHLAAGSSAIWRHPQDLFLPCSRGACMALSFAWLELLTTGDVASATAVFSDLVEPQLRVLSGGHGGAQHEWLVVAFVRMLYRFTDEQTSANPRHYREFLLQSLKVFPANSDLLSLYVRSESRGQLAARSRLFFDEALATHPGTSDSRSAEPAPVVWLYAIASEFRRAGSRHRVHRLFEKALRSPSTHSMVALWRLYIRYEISVLIQKAQMPNVEDPEEEERRRRFIKNPNLRQIRDERSSDALKLFYRGVHTCPWSKLLWLDGIRWFQSELSAEQLRQLVTFMEEKEIRVRRPFPV